MPLRTDLRLRRPLPGLLRLPWDTPLEDWSPDEVGLREMPVGPSRHLVRFVESDGRMWAIKELPERVASRSTPSCASSEVRELPAVKAAGLVHQPESGNALLVTRYLDRSWQFRRLLIRLPPNRPPTGPGCSTPWRACSSTCTATASTGATARSANTLFSADGSGCRPGWSTPRPARSTPS
jgi:hypothetical protein